MSILRRAAILSGRNYYTALAAGATASSGYPNPSPITIPDRPTAAYYDELINVAGRHGDLDTVHNLLHKRMRDGIFNTTDTFKFLTATESSLSALDDLLRTLTRLDRGITRKNAFDTLIARLCKIGRVQDALLVAEAMLGGACAANAVTFHPIISSLTRKDVESAWRVVEAVRDRGIALDVTTYNYFLTSYCVAGDVHLAAAMVGQMAEDGMRADTRTYDALVLGACRAGKVEGALAILRRMADEGIPALYSTHAHVIKAMLKCGYHAQAVEFVRSCGGSGDRALETESSGMLAAELIKEKRFELAKLVLDEMARKGLKMGEKLSNFYNQDRDGSHQCSRSKSR